MREAVSASNGARRGVIGPIPGVVEAENVDVVFIATVTAEAANIYGSINSARTRRVYSTYPSHWLSISLVTHKKGTDHAVVGEAHLSSLDRSQL